MADDLVTHREFETFKADIWREVNRLGGIIEGPPHPGLDTRVDRFLTAFETVEQERNKQHAANRWRLNVIIGILTAVGGYMVLFHK